MPLPRNIPVVYNSVTYHKTPAPPCRSVKRCKPLAFNDLINPRPAIQVYPSKDQYEARGGYNKVSSVVICSPCYAPEALWRRALSKKKAPPKSERDREIMLSVVMGENNIGPPIFAVSKDAIFMQRFTCDVADLFHDYRPSARSLATMTNALVRLVKRVSDMGIILYDLKPENSVVKVQPIKKEVSSFRLIDFDFQFAKYAHREFHDLSRHAAKDDVLTERGFTMANFVTMLLHYYLHVRKNIRTQPGKAWASQIRDRLSPLWQKCVNRHPDELRLLLKEYGNKSRGSFAHYFDRQYTITDINRLLR